MTMWILGGVFALVGIPPIWIARRLFARDRAIARWPRAPGVVKSSSLDASRQKYRDKNGMYYDHTVYTPVVRYTYSVDGFVHEGTSISRSTDGFATNQAQGQRCIDKYPPQRQLLVFYDPNDPKTAYLESKRSTGAVILFLFGCVFLAVATLLVALSFL